MTLLSAVLTTSSNTSSTAFEETKRKLTAEKRNTAYFKEELRPTHSFSSSTHPPTEEAFTYLAGSGMAVSKVLPAGPVGVLPSTNPPPPPEQGEKEQKGRVNRLCLVYSTTKRWDVNRIFFGLDWA